MPWVLPTSHLPPFLFALPISILYIYYPNSIIKVSQPLPLDYLILLSSSQQGQAFLSPQSSQGHHTVQPASLTTRAFTWVAPWSQSAQFTSLSPSSLAAFFPVFTYASHLMPGAVSLVSAFCFPQKTMIYFLLLFLQPSFPKFLCIFSSGTTPSHSISSILLLG